MTLFFKIKLFRHCPDQGEGSVGQDLGQTVCKDYPWSTNAPTSKPGVKIDTTARNVQVSDFELRLI